MSKTQRPTSKRTDATMATSQPKPSKKAQLEAMLRRPGGATQKQLEKNLGWQPHTVRAAISRLRKDGIDVLLDRTTRTPSCRIGSAA